MIPPLSDVLTLPIIQPIPLLEGSEIGLYSVERGRAVKGQGHIPCAGGRFSKKREFMECSKTSKMKVRNCTEILHREVRVGCLGLALMTRALPSWPWALPLGTRARGLGFKPVPWLCLGDLRTVFVASGSALGDLLRLCPWASRPCLGESRVRNIWRVVDESVEGGDNHPPNI
jgi:hypothetical protein